MYNEKEIAMDRFLIIVYHVKADFLYLNLNVYKIVLIKLLFIIILQICQVFAGMIILVGNFSKQLYYMYI
jgi:hypothetical protein